MSCVCVYVCAYGMAIKIMFFGIEAISYTFHALTRWIRSIIYSFHAHCFQAMTPKGVTPSRQGVQPAAESGSVAGLDAQPAAAAGGTAKSSTLPLRELSKRSAPFGEWSVVVRQPKVESYEYLYQGQPKNGKVFSCVLVSSDDPTEYCMGQLRWSKNNDSKFLSAQKRLSDGLAFKMTKVSISNDVKKQYIHAPIQTVVNVADTTFSPLLHSKDSNVLS